MKVYLVHFFELLKVYIKNETKGNEGTCIGIAKFPFEDISYKSSPDIWVYRAYSGLVYHAGTQASEEIFECFSQGDYVTCILDLNSRTLMFGKNGEVCIFFAEIVKYRFASGYVYLVINIIASLMEANHLWIHEGTSL